MRSVSSVSLQLLRAIEETLIKGATHNLIVRTRSEVALYVLNHKRAHLRDLEERFRITITISADPTVNAQASYIVDRGEQVHTAEAAKLLAAARAAVARFGGRGRRGRARRRRPKPMTEAEPEAEEEAETPDLMQGEPSSEAPRGDGEREAERDGGRRRRRRGRGRGRGGEPREPRDNAPQFTNETAPEHAIAQEGHKRITKRIATPARPRKSASGGEPRQGGVSVDGENGEPRRRRRRGRRGGRRNRQGRNGDAPFAHQWRPKRRRHAAAAGDFPPVSDEDASGIAPPFDSPLRRRPMRRRRWNVRSSSGPITSRRPPRPNRRRKPRHRRRAKRPAAPPLDHPRTGAVRRPRRCPAARADAAAAEPGDLLDGERG